MKLYEQLKSTTIPGWVLLPMRLFLGITFIYAGIQKLTDPQYLNEKAPGYIGRQIIGFANGSPIRSFLLQVALPHSHAFGLMVAYGEIAIGLGVLVGLLFRLASFFGLFLSVVFFLSASWHVHPYFYGADIVFTFCWITLLLNGPTNTGLPALDVVLASFVIESYPPQQQVRIAQILHFVLGTASLSTDETETVPLPATAATAPTKGQQDQATTKAQPSSSQRPQYAGGGRAGLVGAGSGSKSVQARIRQAQIEERSRRSFLLGIVTGGATMLTLSGLTYFLYKLTQGTSSGDGLPSTGGTNPITGITPVDTSTAATATASTGSSNTIAHIGDIGKNSSLSFTISSNGDPGILIHLDNDQFVAYDAVCTHAGCTVDYDQSSKLLICPCHGAEFDPANNASVVQPPANQPLTSVTIHIDSATGAITM